MANDESKRADIMVSELLGSFGDNELAPECLDGVQCSGLLKETCISIPQRYTSHLAPVNSMRLHSEAQVKAFDPASTTDGPGGKPIGTRQALETPYVVRSHAACQTHAELPCWDFSHPKLGMKDGMRKPNGIPNDRFAQLVFAPDVTHGAGCGSGYGPFDAAIANLASNAANSSGQSSIPSGITIHGFLGTFHCTLYQSPLQEKDSSTISTAPGTFSVGMFSWFPLYFPLRQPLHVPAGASISCSMWRRSDSSNGGIGRVWYEWSAQVLVPGDIRERDCVKVISASPIHNPNGRSYHVKL